MTDNFLCSFLFLIALLKKSQLCVSKVSLLTINYKLTIFNIINNKLYLNIYSTILFYIPKLPLNKPTTTTKKVLILVYSSRSLFQNSKLKISMGFVVVSLLSFEKVNLHNIVLQIVRIYIRHQNIHKGILIVLKITQNSNYCVKQGFKNTNFSFILLQTKTHLLKKIKLVSKKSMNAMHLSASPPLISRVKILK